MPEIIAQSVFAQFVSTALGEPPKPVLIKEAPVILQNWCFEVEFDDE
jgi:hypothetical protein